MGPPPVSASHCASRCCQGRALDFSKDIDTFTGSNCDLRGLELDLAEWEAITLVSNWLKAFRSATTEMSTTKKPMLSTNILETLPDTAQPQLRDGLLAAHQKLSEYYYQSDASPYYTWAAILDPRIMYEGLEEDFATDPDLLSHLATSKKQLQVFFNRNYVPHSRQSLTREDFDTCEPLNWWRGRRPQFPTLIPETIQVLMLVKQHLRLARVAFGKADW
ncbi:hypothetical protein BYT27DRAFT_7222760 [Phlegmacium glaucopus]|nr:hypothetical protein BYT27DRAFT_7222760 [Phlegmacium glaucopus]